MNGMTRVGLEIDGTYSAYCAAHPTADLPDRPPFGVAEWPFIMGQVEDAPTLLPIFYNPAGVFKDGSPMDGWIVDG